MPDDNGGQTNNIQFGASNDASTRLRVDAQYSIAGKKKKKKVKKKMAGAGPNILSDRSDSTAHNQETQLIQKDLRRGQNQGSSDNTPNFDQAQNHQLQFIQSPNN